jgi:hypothetical protein
MPYSITLRSRIDATITGWYDGSRSADRPITRGGGSLTTSTWRNRYARNCAAGARAC